MMHHPTDALAALDALPVGARVVAVETDPDGTGSGYLFEHVDRGGERLWKSLTDTSYGFVGASFIVDRFHDMVTAFLPDPVTSKPTPARLSDAHVLQVVIPHVPYGPDHLDARAADAMYYREAARNIRYQADRKHPFAGSNLTEAVARLCDKVAAALDEPTTRTPATELDRQMALLNAADSVETAQYEIEQAVHAFNRRVQLGFDWHDTQTAIATLNRMEREILGKDPQ